MGNRLVEMGSHIWLSEDGATALEYGLLVALIAGVIISAVTTLGQVVGNTFNDISSSMTAAS
ncbi:MAG: Flp family type IVb pilin [Nitrospirales bacterium]|nr:Flp family type IVb pilin [Nitrospira sp.]MDR4501777.1 Flp family type IVb pilin [Nitrospirales bacterium]